RDNHLRELGREIARLRDNPDARFRSIRPCYHSAQINRTNRGLRLTCLLRTKRYVPGHQAHADGDGAAPTLDSRLSHSLSFRITRAIVHLRARSFGWYEAESVCFLSL